MDGSDASTSEGGGVYEFRRGGAREKTAHDGTIKKTRSDADGAEGEEEEEEEEEKSGDSEMSAVRTMWGCGRAHEQIKIEFGSAAPAVSVGHEQRSLPRHPPARPHPSLFRVREVNGNPHRVGTGKGRKAHQSRSTVRCKPP
jgi:hypothetical protein